MQLASNQVRRRAPILFILSGPSGAGKDSVIQELRKRLPDIHYAVTATTRCRRPGEIEGQSYYFLDQPEFERLRERGALLASREVHGNWYGAPLDPIRAELERGNDILLKLDVRGAMDVRELVDGAVFVFLAPPSTEQLIEQLLARHTETLDELERRVQAANFEMEQLSQYDYCVTNYPHRLHRTVGEVASIITAERLRITRRKIELAKR